VSITGQAGIGKSRLASSSTSTGSWRACGGTTAARPRTAMASPSGRSAR
jgi:hypothetical protein